ncbi:MAG: sugar ABC transporter substrate-binding protein [Nocardiopsaceae bacterium]|nr:sugar ABC transporter substrate-binding protein [Nocardiopsaceae bacterium]
MASRPRKRTLGRAVVLAAVTSLVAAAAACGGPSSSGISSSGPIKGQTITYWASVEGTGVQQTTQTLTAQFAKFTKQTGVHVNIQVIPWASLLQKILTAVTSGKGPDVMEIGNTWAPSLAASGGFASFTPSTMSRIGGSAKFSKAALSVSGAPGQAPMSVPVYSEAYGLFYNKADFKAAGISGPPRTWTQFQADARKLTTGGRHGVAIEGGSTSEAAHWAFLLGEQNGSPLYSGGKWNFATTAEAKAIAPYVNLVASGVADKSDAEHDTNVGETEFATNKAAMIVWQNPMSALAQLGMKPSSYGIAPIPEATPGASGSRAIETFPAGINLAIPSASKHQAAALALVKYMTSTPAQVAINKTYGTFPPVLSAQASPQFRSAGQKTLINLYNHHSAPLPRVPSESTMETDLGGAITHLIGQAATGGPVSVPAIKSALTSAQDQLNAASGSGS